LDIIILFLPLLGFIVGNLIGLTGIGGGFLMTPVLVLIGIPPLTAVGTDLLYAALSKATGVTIYARRGNINFNILIYLLAGGVPATLVGYLLLLNLTASQGSTFVNSVVGLLLSVVLLAVGSLYVVQIKFRKSLFVDNSRKITGKIRFLLITVGFITGLTVQFTSVGSGVLITFFLLYFMTQPGRVVGTDLGFGLVITGLGGFLHFTMGNPDFVILLLLLAGATPGIILGTKMNKRIQIGQFRLILMILMMITGVALLIRYGLILL
jgi:uncharacterized membrane protein YfcA